jgi:hypothetical protein
MRAWNRYIGKHPDILLSAIGLAAGLMLSAPVVWAQFDESFDGSTDHPAIEYATRPVRDLVSELDRKVQAGTVQLKFDDRQGYLRSVLEALNVPVESQLVVFSKTSVQQRLISPRSPRVLYFNDSVVVGWVRGGFIELAVQDPEQGSIFYTLDQSVEGYQERVMKVPVRPLFTRRDDCLSCHVSYATLGVAGTLVRSSVPSSSGMPIRKLGDYLSDHRSPFEERWGGWYVTGKHASVRHLGNAIIADHEASEPLAPSDVLPASLKGNFEADTFISRYSDIVALMVFDHQMRMVNLLTRMGWEARFASYERRTDQAARLRNVAMELVDYLLFVDEAALAGPIEGTSGFTTKFAAGGPTDSKGRSLRQFDLERRLMRYPCSYMIYSEAFDALPPEAKTAVYDRMWQILSGREHNPKYARLTLADRQAVVEILRETKKDLPESFRGDAR